MLWFWQYIDSREKDLLYAISLFSSGEGAQVSDLATVLAGILPNKEQVQHKINRLIDLNLIERKREPSSETRYSLHPIVMEFIRQQAPRVRPSYVQLIEQAYIRYMFDFITTYCDDAAQLDQYRQNIVNTFNLVIFDGDHRWAGDEVVKALIHMFPYFERHGMYTIASKFLNQVADNVEIRSAALRIDVLYYGAKAAQFQGQSERAMSLYQETLALIDTSHITQRYGQIRQSIGMLQLQSSRIDNAPRVLKPLSIGRRRTIRPCCCAVSGQISPSPPFARTGLRMPGTTTRWSWSRLGTT